MTIAQYFKKLKVIYVAFISSLIPVIIVAFNYNHIVNLNLGRSVSTLIAYGVILIGLSTVALSFIIFAFFTSKVKNNASLNIKLSAYFRGYILRSSMIEGMALLTAITFALTTVQILLIISVLYVALMIFLIPSKKEIKKVFSLTVNEEVALDNDAMLVS